MEKTLYTLSLGPDEANIEAVRHKLGLRPDQIDADFGVTLLDPGSSQYAVMVDSAAVAHLEGSGQIKGPFANPKIETFGKVED
jgi:hypothetical protein